MAQQNLEIWLKLIRYRRLAFVVKLTIRCLPLKTENRCACTLEYAFIC
jgi:hypothetical protein